MGNTCFQLFVTYKVFSYVTRMKSKGKVLAVITQFVKETGALEAFVSDTSREQNSYEIK